MQLTHLLFLVTLGQDGGMSAAYSAYPDKDECEGALAAVSSVFDAQKVKSAYRGCVMSPHQFSPFEHKVADDAPVYVTLNRLDNGKLQVSLQKDMAACTAAKSGEQSWCAQTFQTMLR